MSTAATLSRGLVKGAIAGAAATWVMGQVTSYMYEHEDPEAREREDSARGGVTAYERGAGIAADAVGVELTEAGRRQAGTALHWATGVGAGALYGAVRELFPGISVGQGSGFGAAFFLAVDEGLVPILGLTPGPGAFPWQAHFRGLAGHLVFGVVADTVLDVLDRVA